MTMILIAANPNAKFEIGRERIGLINAHVEICQRLGAVFWRLVPAGGLGVLENWKPPYTPTGGYFYDVSERDVTHKFEVARTFYGEDILIPDDLRRFVPDFREGWGHIENGYILLLRNIQKLKVPHRLADFWLEGQSRRVQFVENYVWIEDF